jgi:uroporphyrinogen decarboxylase
MNYSLENWPWKPDPDYRRLLEAIYRRGDPQRVPLLELFADLEIIGAFLGEPPIPWPERPGDRQRIDACLDQKIRFWHALGYDALWQGPVLDFPGLLTLQAEDTAPLPRQRRGWMDEKAGAITDWPSFERYPWPRPQEADFYPLEAMASRLPQGMGILAEISGVYEPVSWLMGYETLSLALYEQPDLVTALFERIRAIILPLARALAQQERVIGIWMGDDLGFKTGTLISPRHLRQYVFPIQKEVAEIAHAAGLPFILHSCGNLAAVMEDLITEVRIDAKHSFEDVIQPVEVFVAGYQQRLCAIGGVDVDLLCSGTEERVRARTRQLLEACAPSRAYVLGSGNSVANYIPLQNYLAMVDECWRFNTQGQSQGD